MIRRPVAAQVMVSLCAMLVLAACATGSNSSPSPAAGAAVVLTNSSAGDHLAGPNGHALYVFKTDSANTSTCTDTCAQNWPPLTVAAGTAPSAASGVAAKLGTLTRSDGSLQVTANGMPLYYFAGDTAATDINGQGKNGVWFLAATDGSALTGPDMSPAASPKSSDDGYY